MNIEGKSDDAAAALTADASALIRQTTGKATGNAGGKILPVLLPGRQTTTADAATGLSIKPEKPAETGNQPATDLDADLDPAFVALGLAWPAQTFAAPVSPATARATSAAASSAITKPAATEPAVANAQLAAPLTAASLTAAPLSVKLAERAALPAKLAAAQTTVAQAAADQAQTTDTAAAGLVTVTAKPVVGLDKQPAADPQQPRQQVAQAEAQLAAQAPLAAALALAPEAARAAIASLRLEPAAAQSAAAQPASTMPQAAAGAVQLSVELPAQPKAGLAQRDGGKPARSNGRAIAAPATLAALQASPAAKVDAPAATAGPDRIADETVTKSAAPAARQIEPDAAPVGDRSAAGTAAPGKPASAVDAPAAEPTKPIAAELQPILAMRDAQSASQAGTPAPVTAAAVAAPAGHDFTALVDRLVEARDAAMPDAIRAAISHSDFGQVSLNFKTDDARLTVSMTSADPGFAPAVQAAAAMQAGASTDNGTGSGTGSQRQDGQSQQQSQNGTVSNQPQSQAQSNAQAQSQGSAGNGERQQGQAFRASGSKQQPATGTDEALPDQRSGIYA